MTAAVAIEGLTKRFGSFAAVDDLSLEVPEGSLFGFLGANGAGKTTTIRMIAGLARPAAVSGRAPLQDWVRRG
jgi:ABC-2 type transport system ATP-binding protein